LKSRFRHLYNVLGLVVAGLIIFAFFAWKIPSFSSWQNIQLLARQTTIVALAAVGMTIVIISGAIDLSIGSVVALVTVVIAWCLREGYSPMVALGLGVGTAALCGLVNGTVITQLKVGPFIVTLGTLLIYRGVAKGIGNEQNIQPPESWLNGIMAILPKEKSWMLFSPGVWVCVVGALVGGFLLNYTRFGRHVVAVGSNEEAARYSAVSIKAIRLKVFILMGFFAGLAGLMQFSRLTLGSITVAVGLELDVIAAVVIGGASLSGGSGTIFGSMIGALIMSVMRAGGSQMGWPNWVQEIVTGVIIVLAVAIDRLRVRSAKS
jgi:ribose/xylose/arabinose/galactoside ABC-type transport system permease subunit